MGCLRFGEAYATFDLFVHHLAHRALLQKVAPEQEITGSLQLAAAQRDVERAGGASWVSLHHGGGVGMGYSQHSGIVIVCDGTEAADKRIARVLWNDPGTGVMRHADAGYDTAKQKSEEHTSELQSLMRSSYAVFCLK